MPRFKGLVLGVLSLSLGLGAMALLQAPPAQACGGFFCTTLPIDQAGERIFFAKDGNDIVAHVQIQYTGSAEDFSWVIPVPQPPKLGVGSDRLFSVLSQQTQPQFNLTNIETQGMCNSFPVPAATSDISVVEREGVNVISEERVGPFESAVIQSTDPAALKNWLEDNGYQIPSNLDPLLDPYIKAGMYFLALKLRKDRDVGDLQPITMRYPGEFPMVPIQLTAVAATPDMDVFVWVLGKDRAIPKNYKHAQINETRIDWLSNGSNYRQVVTEAINETGGLGFVTDYAGQSTIIDKATFDPNQFDLDVLRQTTEPFAFRDQLQSSGLFVNSFGGLDFNRMTLFLSRHIPKPASLVNTDALTYVQNLDSFRGEIEAAGIQVATSAAVEELEETVITPYEEINKLFGSHPYLTRLYSTISPQEMTVDPVFEFNPDLPEVSNIHEATAVRLCSEGADFFSAPTRITLENGVSFEVAGFAPLAEGPAAAVISELRTSGAEFVIQDNSAQIATLAEESLTDKEPEAPEESSEPKPETSARPSTLPSTAASAQPLPVKEDIPILNPSASASPTPETGTGCSCDSPNAPPPPLSQGAGEGLTYTLAALGFLGWRRQRRKS